MKFVVASIRPFNLDDVHEALLAAGVTGMTVSEVKVFGRQKGHREIYRAAEYEINYVPKVKIEVVVAASLVEKVVEIIIGAAKTGATGDGQIFVFGLDDVVCIPTGGTVNGGDKSCPLAA
jgi:nitrogen regulatory protein P-II 2